MPLPPQLKSDLQQLVLELISTDHDATAMAEQLRLLADALDGGLRWENWDGPMRPAQSVPTV